MFQPSVEELQALGWNIIPIRPSSKAPMVKWKANQTEQWKGVFPEGCGYAAIMGNLTGYIVVDTDTEASEKFIKAQVPETGIMVKTRKGFHRYYKWPESGAQTLLRFDRYNTIQLSINNKYPKRF